MRMKRISLGPGSRYYKGGKSRGWKEGESGKDGNILYLLYGSKTSSKLPRVYLPVMPMLIFQARVLVIPPCVMSHVPSTNGVQKAIKQGPYRPNPGDASIV